jgi:4-hydroxybenzoyl-CoA thioesterase
VNGYAAQRPVRFADCDPAGIAYYPKLFELSDSVIEDWTLDIVGISRREMHLDRGLGLPTARLEAEFHSPARLGETLDIELSVTRVGRSSVDLRLDARCEGHPRFTIKYRQVLFRMADGSSLPWPEEWHGRLAGQNVAKGEE